MGKKWKQENQEHTLEVDIASWIYPDGFSIFLRIRLNAKAYTFCKSLEMGIKSVYLFSDLK